MSFGSGVIFYETFFVKRVLNSLWARAMGPTIISFHLFSSESRLLGYVGYVKSSSRQKLLKIWVL